MFNLLLTHAFPDVILFVVFLFAITIVDCLYVPLFSTYFSLMCVQLKLHMLFTVLFSMCPEYSLSHSFKLCRVVV
jgi:hypothetical protein